MMENFERENPYDILGVDKTATKKEIKSAYYKAIKESHPDKNKRQKSYSFRRSTFAYGILNNTEKRKIYDETGQTETVKVPSLDDQAIAILSLLVNRSVATIDENIVSTDFVSFLRKSLKVDITNFKKNLVMTKRTLSHYRIIQKKLRIPEEKTKNVLEALISHEIENYTKSLKTLFNSIRIRQHAIKLLKDYTWEMK